MDLSPPRRPRLRPAAFVEPCIPTLARKPPTGPAWLHEIKHDGYRLMVWRDGERVRLFTRRGFDCSERYPLIERTARDLPVSRFLIDGEAVVCSADGVADFDKLHSRQHDAAAFLYVFDLLMLGGGEMRGERLDARRAKLGELIKSSTPGTFEAAGIRLSEALDGDGATIFRHACKLGCEGIVSKRRDAGYRSGRSTAWLKVKNPDSPAVQRLVDVTR